jgi:hypothetical protein
MTIQELQAQVESAVIAHDDASKRADEAWMSYQYALGVQDKTRKRLMDLRKQIIQFGQEREVEK